MYMKHFLFTIYLILFSSSLVFSQEYDLLLKGGHVIDPQNQLDSLLDVAIQDGKISLIAADIPKDQAKKVIPATGLYVVPGIIDIHTHNFWGTQPNAYLSNSYSALPPDGFTFRAGVTTVVDAGSAGWRNFEEFKRQTIDQARTRVLCFLNIVGHGMRGGPYEQDLSDMDPKLTAMKAQQYQEHIVGIKLAHYSGETWEPTEKAVKAGDIAEIPVMIDFGGSIPTLSIEELFMEKLRPGDIFTHCFAQVIGREAIVDGDGNLKSFILPAQERGIVFDVGHGGGSFVFRQALAAVTQGLKPQSISTDLHTGSMNGGMKDMANVMSKFLNMGLSLYEVIERSTYNPAQIIQRPDLGHMSEGAIADIAIIQVAEGDFGFIDVQGGRLGGRKKIVPEVTLKDGNVVWDLNGISYPTWDQSE